MSRDDAEPVGASSSEVLGQPSLWCNHDFMILWGGETVSQLGSSMSFFIFPIIGYSLSGSTTQAALALAAYTLGTLTFGLQAGALIDRWNPKTVLLWSNVAGALLFGSLVVALTLDRLTIVQLVVTAFLAGIAGSFFDPAEQASIKAIVPAPQLATALSQNQARQQLASLVGPPVGGLFYSVGRSVPFLVDTVTFAVSSLAITRLRAPLVAPGRDVNASAKLRHDIAAGLTFLMSRGFFRATVVFAAIVNLGVEALILVITLKLLQAGVNPAAIGTIDMVAGVAGLVGAILAPSLIKRVPTGIVSIGTALLIVVGILPMAFTNNVVLIGLLLAVAFAGVPASNTAVMSYLVAVTPDRLQGRVASALGFTGNVFQPLGPVVGGVLLAVFGGEVAILLTAGIISIGVVALVVSKETRGLPVPDKWDVSSAAG